MPLPPKLETLAVDITYRIFRYLRKSVKHDMAMMEVIVVSKLIKEYLPSPEEERQIWLAHLETECNCPKYCSCKECKHNIKTCSHCAKCYEETVEEMKVLHAKLEKDVPELKKVGP